MKRKPLKPPETGVSEAIDRRVRRSRETVLAVAYQLLSETGIGGISIEAVAKRSGVAKTTIYRHWPTRAALLLDACSQSGTKPRPPDTGSFKEDLTALAMYVANKLKTGRWSSVLPSIIDAAERDTEIAALHSKLHAEMMGAFRSVIQRGHERGEIPRNRKAAEIISAVVGPLFYRRWFSREPLNQAVVNALVRDVIASLKPK